jgi:hypothetical protein
MQEGYDYIRLQINLSFLMAPFAGGNDLSC